MPSQREESMNMVPTRFPSSNSSSAVGGGTAGGEAQVPQKWVPTGAPWASSGASGAGGNGGGGEVDPRVELLARKGLLRKEDGGV